MQRDPARATTAGTVAIDVGGTFTDVTFADSTGATWVTKTPSTPDDLAAGFITAIRKVRPWGLIDRGPGFDEIEARWRARTR